MYKRFRERMSEERIPRWYAFVTRPRHEKKVKVYLEEAGIEHYLPLIQSWRKWADRRKQVEIPLFSCYIFARIPYVDRYAVLTIPSVARIVSFNKKPTPVRDEEIEDIKMLLASGLDVEVEDGLVKGDAVEIKSGVLKGMSGRIVKRKGRNLFAVYVDAVAKTIFVDVAENIVERI